MHYADQRLHTLLHISVPSLQLMLLPFFYCDGITPLLTTSAVSNELLIIPQVSTQSSFSRGDLAKANIPNSIFIYISKVFSFSNILKNLGHLSQSFPFAFPYTYFETLESPLDCKEIQPVHPEGDQSWLFMGRTDAEAETPIVWPPHVKSWLIGKDPDAGRDWGQEEKGTPEDEMAGWHHRFDAHESE